MDLASYLGERIVIDLRSPFVCIGVLKEAGQDRLLLTEADLHDLRDSPTNRENYVVESKLTGVKKNRKEVVVNAAEVVAVSRLKDVIAD